MLVGHRVILRTAREPDLEGLYDLIADVRTIGDHWPLRVGSESQWLKQFEETGWWKDDFGRMLLTDRDGRILGYLNYYNASHSYEGLEVGYRIFRPEDRGQGYMSEALPLFAAYLFSAKQIHRLQALADTDNEGSRRLLERCGFQHEGTLRGAHFNRGGFHDLQVYSMLRSEAPDLMELLAPT